MHNGRMPGALRRGGRLRLAVVANEFFDSAVGALGGFGWAAARVATVLRSRPGLGIEPVFLRANALGEDESAETLSHQTRAVPVARSPLRHLRRLRRESIDLLLCIDWRPTYRRTLLLLPRTPAIVWSRDPRDREDWKNLATLRVPGSDVPPRGVDPIDCTSLRGVVAMSRLTRRRMAFTTPSPPLGGKFPETYALRAGAELLPNPLELPRGPMRKSPTPVVLFLGRLDPYKRPWLFVELARRFPEAEFVMLGKAHFDGRGGWSVPDGAPPNLRCLGHQEGEEKGRQLERAWVLVNTSIHEGLPVSFQEALSYETPIVAGRNPERVTERFGIYTGQWNGTGEEGLDAFTAGLGKMLRDDALRQRLGREGREWVERTHGTDRFLDAFLALVRRLVPSWAGPDGGGR